MSNEFYSYASNALIPSTVARTQQVNNIGIALEAAFDKFPTEVELKQQGTDYGIESGIANAYIVTMPYTSALVDGVPITFKVGSTNTDASTLNVDDLGAKAIKYPNGEVLRAGALIENKLAQVRYNSSSDTYDLMTLTSDTATDAQTALNALTLCQAEVANAQAEVINAQAQVTLTNADVVLTHADVITCSNLVAGVNLPAITLGSKGKALLVNDAETAYELKNTTVTQAQLMAYS